MKKEWTAQELKERSWRFDDEAFNKWNFNIVDELIHPNFVNHDPLPGQEPTREGIKKFLPVFQKAFPDLQFINDSLIAEGDIVAHRITWRGTHSGEYLGVPATGKKIHFRTHDFQRWEDGLMIERWSTADVEQMLIDLGIKS
jgi:steroid delta-isomerase-like uncharacterized protein